MVAMVSLLVVLISSTPALAADPPDTNVDVGVVTPGDLDLNVDVEAGGNVNAIIDGIELDGVAHDASLGSQAYSWWANADDMKDYLYYWERTGLKATTENRFATIEELINMLLDAQAKLITLNGSNQGRISSVTSKLEGIDREMSAVLPELQEHLSIVTEQVDRNEEQLVSGAEAHISALQISLASEIATRGAETASFQAQLDDIVRDNIELSVRVGGLQDTQRRLMLCVGVLGGCFVFSLLLVVLLFLRKRTVR
jgi:hypothetical protein